ncbi:cyclin-dependent kinase 12 [Pleuronectes platessa]|uniref:cyclin-dependent kinase 12 n=1 Tax=Pleuronectes platessa TaxID=8262 RepID=UPI00232A3602|nr:cyclin-dependent kinase 12 [Pleuronectes platessa]
MMYSNRAEHSNRRPYGDRSARQRDNYDDRWEERRDPHRDSYQKHGGDGHSSAEKTNNTRGYSDSPKRWYGKDRVSRDGSRKSPVRGRMSSPDWGAADKTRRRYAKDHEDDYRYRREPDDRKHRQSPDSFSHKRAPKDFERALPQDEDLKYRKPSQDSRHRHKHEEYPYRQQHDDYKSSVYYKDKDHHKGRWDHSEERTRSQERTGSQERSTKTCGQPREKNDCRSKGHEYHHQIGKGFPLNEPCGQSFESDIPNQGPSVPEQNSTRGFQRFLDLLNKGVNVAMLNKVVAQNPPEVKDGPRSPVSFNTAERQWSPSSARRQQGSHQNNHCWTESKGSQRPASPQPHHRSFSPKRCSPPDEKSLFRGDAGQSYYSLTSRSRSPSVVGNTTLTPEDEHKHRQMQDVLQAIGMDLGSEELGQMSHRIQERLYGKKDSDRCRHHGGNTERDKRRAFSQRNRSRSSSSNRSNFSSLTRDSYVKKDSCSGSARRDVTEVHQIQVHQAVEYDQNDSSSSLKDSEQCETNSQENTAALQTFSPSTTYSLLQSPPIPAIPTYSPVNYSQLPYPALHPSLPPNPPLNFPHVRPGLFLPPYLPYPNIRPMNIFPAALTQTSHLLPQHISNPQSALFNQESINPLQPLNTAQKFKTQARPRCLQVIETKQPG